MLYLGWIAAAFMGGYLFCCWHKGRQKQTAPQMQPTLQTRCSAIDYFRGLRYDEVLCLLNLVPQSTAQGANGQTLRTWSDARYSITLGFDADEMCEGVQSEQIF